MGSYGVNRVHTWVSVIAWYGPMGVVRGQARWGRTQVGAHQAPGVEGVPPGGLAEDRTTHKHFHFPVTLQ